ncbi:MAG: PKD domain-containing protein [Actinomycetota bacterium]|nr:PKD domain-containing protein [Actinomycetota bacterium]
MKSHRVGWLAALAALATTAGLLSAPVAHADQITLPTAVSAAPAAGTPNVDDGEVLGFAQVGTRMYAAGTFTSVAGSARRGILAMQGPSYALATDFNPAVDGDVNAMLPGPTPSTLYIAGAFQKVGGTTSKSLALVDATTGARISTFKANPMNGIVNTVKRVGNRLFVGGTFTTFAGQPRGGLATLNATTGVLDTFVTNKVTGTHNYDIHKSDPCNCAAKGATGVTDLTITPDGSKLVAIGDFTAVDGLPRDQVVMLDLTGTSSVVKADWATHRYEPSCYWWAYDSYIRDVDMSADGSWFSIASSGGGQGTLCDSTTRWETNATGTDVQPTWVSAAGGDSNLSTAIAGDVVYAGGHARWSNNPLGNDQPGAGAVPRPGLEALDARTGMPLAWNPGRNPRGSGAKGAFVTNEGLWIGSDTTWIGNYRYNRGRIAFFPISSAATMAPESVASLPAGVYQGTQQTNSSILYRVDAGGGTIGATDDGPDWADDSGSTNPYRNSGSNAAGWSAVPNVDSTVPSTTPRSIFDSERWDPNDSTELQWAFPVPAGTQIQVRLYFANRCTCTATQGQRVFNVNIDGQTVLPSYDIVKDVGDQTGTMKSFDITSDGLVNIDFGHVAENPLVNGIEIVKSGGSSTPPAYSTFRFDGSSVSAPMSLPIVLDPTTVRGSTVIGGRLFYGKSNGDFAWRQVGTSGQLDAENLIDPYNDPTWSTVTTGSTASNGTTVYRGTRPDFYNQISSISSMFYSNGFLYYTLVGQSGLYSRAFSPDSGIIYPVQSQVSGVTMPQVTGAFLTGGTLYYVTAADGRLNSVGFANGTLTGTPTTLTGAGIDGVDFRGRLLFLSSPTNQPPTAMAAGTCTNQSCTFSSTGSADAEGPIASYSWAFDDGGASTDPNPVHAYAAAGTHTATLTVTDNQGATATATATVTATATPNQPPTAAAAGSCTGRDCTFSSTGSGDSDGTIASYSWNFGDTTTGTGPNPTHTYAADNTYTVTLTVTDNQGATGVKAITINVAQPANVRPTAAATGSCTGRACTFSSAGSSDSDGTIASYSWDFGDHTTATGPSPTHTYAADGTFAVTLTVTDNQGATGSATTSVTVSTPQPSNITFVGDSAANLSSKSPSVQVPAGTATGDRMILLLTSAAGSVTAGPTGWDLVTQTVSATTTTTVWQRAATATDTPGTAVSPTLDTFAKVDLKLAVYRGAGAITVAQTAVASAVSAHVAPAVTVTAAGSWLVSYFADRSTAIASLTPGAGVTSRDVLYGSGSGKIDALLGDSSGSVAVGNTGTRTTTSDAKSIRDVTLSLVLPPA